jgi:hypothetical protein
MMATLAPHISHPIHENPVNHQGSCGSLQPLKGLWDKDVNLLALTSLPAPVGVLLLHRQKVATILVGYSVVKMGTIRNHAQCLCSVRDGSILIK